jgi:copper chaperone CopZ
MVVRSLLFYTIFLLATGPLQLFGHIWQIEVSIDNIDCPMCVERVEKKLQSIPGVDKCKLIEAISLAKITWKKDAKFSADAFWEVFFDTPFQIRELTLDVEGVLSQRAVQKSSKEQKGILTLYSEPDHSLFYIENPNFKELKKFSPGQRVIINGRVESKRGWNYLEVREIRAQEEEPAPEEPASKGTPTAEDTPPPTVSEPVKQPTPTVEKVVTPATLPEPVKQPTPTVEKVTTPATMPEPVKQPTPTVEKVAAPAPATAPEPVKQPPPTVEKVAAPTTMPEPVKQPTPTIEKVAAPAPATAPEPVKQPPPTVEKVAAPATMPEPTKQPQQIEEKAAPSTPQAAPAIQEQNEHPEIKEPSLQEEPDTEPDDLMTIFKGQTSST